MVSCKFSNPTIDLELLPASLQTPKVSVKRLGEESGEEAGCWVPCLEQRIY